MRNSKRQSSLSNPQGQALVEYILMLVVSVSLILALAYQVFTPLRDYLKDYMGSYIACLLETGELPSLGNETSQSLLQNEGCNAKFQAATVANGRPPSGSSNSGSSSSQNASNNKDSSSSSSSSGSSDGSSGGSSGSSGRGSRSSRNLLNTSGRRTGADGAVAEDGKTTEIPLSSSASKFYNRRSSSSIESSASKKTMLGDVTITDDEKKKQARKEGTNQTIALPDGSGAAPKKIAVQKPVRKIAMENEEEPMTFGNFFRILLIAAIIIALVMVLGSQALKIVKSQEK